MDETLNQTTEADITEPSNDLPEPTRLQLFVYKHPRAAKVAAILGATGTAVGAVLAARTVQSNRQHAIEAGEAAKEALAELTATVDPATGPEA